MLRPPPRSTLFPTRRSSDLVLPTSASAIYGGRASGGVMNVVLRHDYEGAELSLTYENVYRGQAPTRRSEEHTSELQSQSNLVCRLLLEKKKKKHAAAN